MENDEVMCRGYILNSLLKKLNNTYRPMKTEREIWDALHNKYFSLKKDTGRFIVVNYFDLKFDPNKSMMDEIVHLVYIVKLAELNIVVPDAIQAPNQWHKKFDDVILANGFKHNGAHKCIYSKSCNEYIVILCLYVDDMLIFSNYMEGIIETKKCLSSVFEMKGLGKVDTILGIKVKRYDKGFTLSQTHYIDKMIDKFKYLDIKEALTPYDHSKILEENKGRVVAQLEYASVIESLMYAAYCTRIDIAFAQQADFLMDIALWPQSMGHISLFCDNQAAIARAYSEIYNGKSRHISMRHAYVRKMVGNGVVTVTYVKTEDNLADPHTNPLSREMVERTATGMGLKISP
ncbi:hypothetical protein LIER_11072 [Lithospermum erythrorhizon]|uniref:Reverse transcriptase Ty1/copia-type domain-containing protein n=1 Tax=Lithospermum erythrorhizon TaxID=34254 RepID=A0AAV3PR15_LITER